MVKKVVFIENRHKTHFYEELARWMEARGWVVRFLVQNHMFCPAGFDYELLYYPKKKSVVPRLAAGLSEVSKSDRNVLYYGGDYYHYAAYSDQITKFFDEFDPDVTIGEATLFHELLAAKICSASDRLYLNPTGVGYPRDHFSLFLYEKKKAVSYKKSGSGYDISSMISGIKSGRNPPRYIEKVGYSSGASFSSPRALLSRFTQLLRLAISRFFGEKFNTPSIKSRITLRRVVKKKVKSWHERSVTLDELVSSKNEGPRKILLYPLQMQPESNIDVWGVKFRDQAQLISKIMNNLPEDWVLVLKMNPKPKFELNNLDLEALSSKVKLISYDTKMSDLLEYVDCIVTVTGTVLVEAIVNKIPVIQFGESFYNSASWPYFSDFTPSQFNKFLRNVDQLLITDEQVDEAITALVSTVNKGIISDPINDPDCMSCKNVEHVASSIIRACDLYRDN